MYIIIALFCLLPLVEDQTAALTVGCLGLWNKRNTYTGYKLQHYISKWAVAIRSNLRRFACHYL